ncbi:MAG: 3-deoxy-manno-octulosonate cytidylyltransferase [Gemmatimonadaceae bacterium]|nr:3-deoxy-manno-octulosonate cytidylyltransferase [Gemmatimonadaceae bacterium]
MKVLAVIPARLGATRLPRKPLRLIAGVPLINRVLGRVVSLGVADAVVVATDSTDIEAVVRSAGGTAVLTRGDHPSGTDRMAEVARRPEYRDFEVLLNVQGDEPFVTADALRGAVEMVRERGFPLGTAATLAPPAVLRDPGVVKVVCASDGRALYFSRAPIPWCRDAVDVMEQERLIRQHVGVYACRREALFAWVALPPHPLERVERLEQLRALAGGLAMGVALVDPLPAGGIDTEDDLERANARWTDLYAGRP